jgi:hypothetical protein
MKTSNLTRTFNYLLAVLTMFLASMPSGVMMATTVTTTALNASYQAMYADGSKGLADLRAQVFFGAEFDQLFTPVRTNLTTYRKAISHSTSSTQAGQVAFTPNGSFSFTPAETPLFWVKDDHKFSAVSMRATWLGSLYEVGKDAADQSFSKYILENHCVPQHIEDVELNGCYAGVFVTPTPGVSGAVGAMMDGFKKTLNAKITATTITPITTGTIPTGAVDFVTYVEEFWKQVNKRDWKRPMTLAMSADAEQLFKEGMQLKYNSQYRDTDMLNKLKHFPNVTVSGQIAMGSSTKMFASPKDNLVHPYNPGATAVYQFEVEDRSLKVWHDRETGYGTHDDSRVYTNSEELV